jgi:sortase (surface protein transpeptidase)
VESLCAAKTLGSVRTQPLRVNHLRCRTFDRPAVKHVADLVAKQWCALSVDLSKGIRRRILAAGAVIGGLLVVTSCTSAGGAPTAPAPTAEPTAALATLAPTMAPRSIPTPGPATPTAVQGGLTPPPPSQTRVWTPTAVVIVAPTPSPTPAPKTAEPAAVSIPRLGTAAEIVPLGLEADGATIEAPVDPDTVGWYRFSAQLGAPGNAVLMGHVDWGGRLRAFGLLRQLQPGDRVVVADTLGREFTYLVRDKQIVDAQSPAGGILAQSGPGEELTLITCGGEFDRKSHQYLSRVIVRAVRDDDASKLDGDV